MMKKIASILVFLLLTRCISNTAGNQAVPLKAVYFVQGQGELSAQDLQAHPEVAVVQTFDGFKQYAKQKVALWIDKSVAPLNFEQEVWINTAPQAYYPIALIGTNDTMHAFRDLLQLRCFWVGSRDELDTDTPGFSIVRREPSAHPTTGPMDVIFVHGYNQKPTVQSILQTTNDLLEETISSTPIAILPTPSEQVGASASRQVLLYDEWPCGSFPMDTANITAVILEKNILKIQVTYQGGCQEHTFELYAATAFLMSNPPQALLHLSHDSHGDTCTERIEKRLSFDLTPLDKSRADRQANPLILRVYEPVSGSFANEPYMPLIEWP